MNYKFMGTLKMLKYEMELIIDQYKLTCFGLLISARIKSFAMDKRS